VKLWDVTTGKERAALAGHQFPNGTVEYVTFCLDSTTLASAGGNTVKLWDTATGRELAEVRCDDFEGFFWVGFQGNGMTLLSRRQFKFGHLPINHELNIWHAPLVK
jgi:WD40 repeat protein